MENLKGILGYDENSLVSIDLIILQSHRLLLHNRPRCYHLECLEFCLGMTMSGDFLIEWLIQQLLWEHYYKKLIILCILHKLLKKCVKYKFVISKLM